MPKLSLKETEAEREERKSRKAQRAARKAARYHNYDLPDDPSASTSGTRLPHKKPSMQKEYGYVFDEEGGWMPSAASEKFDYREDLRAEEDDFRAKLFDEMELDACQDAAQAMFSGYHIPSRWRDRTGHEASGSVPQSKTMMDDEEYAEYVRRGMWERTHKADAEERVAKEKERAKRKKKEKTLREKTKEIEREEVERRRRKKEERANEQFVEGWKAYERRWANLQQAAATATLVSGSLGFDDLPWPVVVDGSRTSLEGLNREVISAFLLSPLHSAEKSRRARVRGALLLYHPDRFESRLMMGVRHKERDRVKDAVGRVARALTSLAEETNDE
ncbi:hypothetical protein FRB95_001791 [Tulasnella sp. JGI-2019a]|nr:hypothetical protein FRB95_001791 [Tulasnella sp. JGI-2019a]